MVFISGPGIINFMNLAIHISYFPNMVKGIIRWNRYDPVPNGIIPVPEFGINESIIMVHAACPGNVNPVGYPVVVIDFTVPDGIVMIVFYMIRT